jgi:hypothetical protein
MSVLRVLSVSAMAGVVGLGSMAAAQGPMPIARRVNGVLAADLTLDAIYLCRDLDCNGDFRGPGEVNLFLGPGNASGLNATGAVFAMVQAIDGTVYIADGDTDTVYAAKDLNKDGDAMDAGEVRAYFTTFNASLLPMPTPNGLAVGPDGSVYIVNSGVSASPLDAVFRTKDLNADGDADDVGEQSVFIDMTAIGVLNSAPFECSVIGDTVYFVDTRGSADDVILSGRDADNSGSVDATELGTFYIETMGSLVPVSFTCQTDGVSIYTHEFSQSAIQTVWRLTDTDANGSIDELTEATQIWIETSLPMGSTMSNSFSMSLGPRKLAISSHGTDPNDAIIIATDIDGNGDYNDAGGTVVAINGDANVSFPENLRYVMFYGTPCPADINNSGALTVQDIFDFLALYFSNSPAADINASCSVSVQDIFDFLSLYFAGC